MQAEERDAPAMGVDYQLLDSGCCGMAGSFGFEAHKYDVSVAAGERVLLPAVRAAAADTLIIANGFSCQEQIVQLTGRRPLHLAEVLQMALQSEANDRRASGDSRRSRGRRSRRSPIAGLSRLALVARSIDLSSTSISRSLPLSRTPE